MAVPPGAVSPGGCWRVSVVAMTPRSDCLVDIRGRIEYNAVVPASPSMTSQVHDEHVSGPVSVAVWAAVRRARLMSFQNVMVSMVYSASSEVSFTGGLVIAAGGREFFNSVYCLERGHGSGDFR